MNTKIIGKNSLLKNKQYLTFIDWNQISKIVEFSAIFYGSEQFEEISDLFIDFLKEKVDVNIQEIKYIWLNSQ